MKRTAEFDGAHFSSKVSFENLRVAGSIFFRTDSRGNQSTFEAHVSFLNAHISGAAEFDGAIFKGPADFDSVHVEGYFFARPDKYGNAVSFNNGARFFNAEVEGTAEFQSAKFTSASFYGTRFNSHAWFMDAQFTIGGDFTGAHFEGPANFSAAEFGSIKETRFTKCRFERGARFDGAIFRGSTDFGGSINMHDAHFPSTQFLGHTSFRAARFRSIYFGTPHRGGPTQSHESELSDQTLISGSLDLRGLNYDDIYAELPGLFAKIEPFDRQPYSQLEAVLLRRGDENRANQVYLERRRFERAQKLQQQRLSPWLLDWGYKLIANYGVRPYRLGLWATLLILLGTAIFFQPGALKMRASQPISSGVVTSNAHVTVSQALSVSIHYFLPMDVPYGDDFVPTGGSVPLSVGKRQHLVWVRADFYAAVLRIIGSLLVGLTLAATTGLLRRIAR